MFLSAVFRQTDNQKENSQKKPTGFVNDNFAKFLPLKCFEQLEWEKYKTHFILILGIFSRV